MLLLLCHRPNKNTLWYYKIHCILCLYVLLPWLVKWSTWIAVECLDSIGILILSIFKIAFVFYFMTISVILHYILSDDSMTDKWWIGNDLKWSGHGQIEVPTWHLPRDSRKPQKNSIQVKFPLKFKLGVYWVQVWSVTATPTHSVLLSHKSTIAFWAMAL